MTKTPKEEKCKYYYHGRCARAWKNLDEVCIYFNIPGNRQECTRYKMKP